MTTIARASPTPTCPAGIGLPGLERASDATSTTSFSDPMDACNAVMAAPSRSASPGTAPATSAIAAVAAPSRIDGNGWVRRTNPAIRRVAANRRGASDVHDLREVRDEVGDQAVPPVPDLGPDPG